MYFNKFTVAFLQAEKMCGKISLISIHSFKNHDVEFARKETRKNE